MLFAERAMPKMEADAENPAWTRGCCSLVLSSGATAGTDQGWSHTQEIEWLKDLNLTGPAGTANAANADSLLGHSRGGD